MQPNTTCKVCGKEYYCCIDSRKYGGYRAVACSPECFQEYMRQVEEARKPIVKIVVEDTSSIKKKTNKVIEVSEADIKNEILEEKN